MPGEENELPFNSKSIRKDDLWNDKEYVEMENSNIFAEMILLSRTIFLQQ